MQNQSPFDLVVTEAAAIRRSPPLLSRLRPRARRRLARPVAAPPIFAAGQPVPSSRQFLHGTTLLQSIQHFVKRVAVRSSHMQAGGNIVHRRRIAPNLQKSQDVIGTQV